MTPERYARLDALLDGASEVPEPERAEWLAGECADDPDLAWEVERLLALEDDDSGRNFLAEPALDQAARDLVVPAHGALTGHAFAHYDVVEYLGGGMSEVYRAHDRKLGRDVVLKLLPAGMSDPDAMTRLAREARTLSSLNHPHVVTIHDVDAVDGRVFLATEYVEGQTLTQWMIDHPRPALEAVRRIVEQAARGLLAFHRLEMLHQDLRPDNIMIDTAGTVKIIDFGSTRVAGIEETMEGPQRGDILGTAQYTAPEYFLGEGGSPRSDIFSLGVITYQMLTGKLPYGAQVARARTRSAQGRLRYDSVLADDREIPAWIDGVLNKAVHADPKKRYAELSELVFDLRHPNHEFLTAKRPPLVERDPVMFWKGVSLLLAIVAVLLLLFGGQR